jgi:hypothetical protein
MIKKTIIYLILTLFTTAVAADELFMKCGPSTYKYIKDPAGDKVFWKNKKGTKNKYEDWCADEQINKTWGQVSKEGWVRIIKGNKATCIFKKVTFINDGKTTERTNSLSVSDFVNLTRHIEWYHTNTGNKKNVKDIKCKKKKK